MTSTYEVERHHDVAAPPEAILERIVDLRRWESWSPWEQLDPEQERTYGGPERGVGAWYEWDGDRKAGAGRMEITRATDRHVDIDLTFTRPFSSRNVTSFHLDPREDHTRVTWSMRGEQTLLLRLFSVVKSMDAMLGPEFERGLAALAREAETAAG